MSIRLADFDLAQIDEALHGEEWALLKRAQADDEFAAAKLLLRYADGQLQNTVVRQVIALGHDQVIRRITAHALKAKGGKGRALPVSPLMLFRGLDAKSPRGRKSRNGDEKLKLLIATKSWLTRGDLKEALANRPATLHRVETKLVEYVQAKFPGASPDTARAYVHQSYPGLPWEDRDAGVDGYDALFRESASVIRTN